MRIKTIDEAVRKATIRSLKRSIGLDAGDLTITIENGCVTLYGTLSSHQSYLKALDATWGTRGVHRVANKIHVDCYAN